MHLQIAPDSKSKSLNGNLNTREKRAILKQKYSRRETYFIPIETKFMQNSIRREKYSKPTVRSEYYVLQMRLSGSAMTWL